MATSSDKRMMDALKALLGIKGNDPIEREEQATLEELTDEDGNIIDDVPKMSKAQEKKLLKKKKLKKRKKVSMG